MFPEQFSKTTAAAFQHGFCQSEHPKPWKAAKSLKRTFRKI
jgi:hypothetical protein